MGRSGWNGPRCSGGPRRRALHLRAGEALELGLGRGSPAPAAALAPHFLLADEGEKEFGYLLDAGAAARDAGAYGDAIGSGAVEGAAKTLGLRLKTRGTRWGPKKRPRDGRPGVPPPDRPMGPVLDPCRNPQESVGTPVVEL